MTEQEFLDIARETTSVYQLTQLPHLYKKKSNDNPKLKDLCIYAQWCIGGMQGGSCWGTDDLSPRPAESEPEIKELDDILSKICPEITYLQYKGLTNNLIHHKDYTEDCYYGNNYNYRIKYIILNELFDKLTEMGLVA